MSILLHAIIWLHQTQALIMDKQITTLADRKIATCIATRKHFVQDIERPLNKTRLIRHALVACDLFNGLDGHPGGSRPALSYSSFSLIFILTVEDHINTKTLKCEK